MNSNHLQVKIPEIIPLKDVDKKNKNSVTLGYQGLREQIHEK